MFLKCATLNIIQYNKESKTELFYQNIFFLCKLRKFQELKHVFQKA